MIFCRTPVRRSGIVIPGMEMHWEVDSATWCSAHESSYDSLHAYGGSFVLARIQPAWATVRPHGAIACVCKTLFYLMLSVID